MLHDDTTAGETFELYGPKNYSMAEIAQLVDREIIKHRRHMNVPKALLKPAAYWANKLLWWHTMSADEVEREYIDQHIDPTAKTFADLGIEPAELSNLTFHYLVCTLVGFIKDSANNITESLPKRLILRPSPCYRAGEERGEEVSPCSG